MNLIAQKINTVLSNYQRYIPVLFEISGTLFSLLCCSSTKHVGCAARSLTPSGKSKQNQYILIITILSYLSSSNFVQAQVSNARKPNHIYNAYLLQPDEKQISIVGNFKIGINNQLEVGSYIPALFYTQTIPNFYLKHIMFDLPHSPISFMMHVFNYNSDDTRRFGGLLSITSTYPTNDRLSFSWSISDYILYSNHQHEKTTLDLIALAGAIDYTSSKKWAWSTVISYPIWSYVRIKSPAIDAEITADYTKYQLDKSSILPTLSFITVTRSWQVFNLEVGVISPNLKNWGPYINLFWRWR